LLTAKTDEKEAKGKGKGSTGSGRAPASSSEEEESSSSEEEEDESSSEEDNDDGQYNEEQEQKIKSLYKGLMFDLRDMKGMPALLVELYVRDGDSMEEAFKDVRQEKIYKEFVDKTNIWNLKPDEKKIIFTALSNNEHRSNGLTEFNYETMLSRQKALLAACIHSIKSSARSQ
jgi:hypothetical protein